MEISTKFKQITTALLAGATLGAASLGITTPKANADEVCTEYVVQKGDTLSEISLKYGISNYMQLAQANHLSNPDNLEVGQKLVINSNGNSSVSPANVASSQATVQKPVAQAPVAKSQANPAPAKASSNYQGSSSVSSVANQMAARTGVPASEWALIIQRESGGNPNVSNASSGAYGLFQLLGHGEHPGMSVSEQMDMATQVYHAQGLSAWAQTR